MEIGQKVKWIASNKLMNGLFVQITEDNKAEVICYKMNNTHCHLTVFVELNIIEFDE